MKFYCFFINNLDKFVIPEPISGARAKFYSFENFTDLRLNWTEGDYRDPRRSTFWASNDF